jgi:hypothetical protein
MVRPGRKHGRLWSLNKLRKKDKVSTLLKVLAPCERSSRQVGYHLVISNEGDTVVKVIR